MQENPQYEVLKKEYYACSMHPIGAFYKEFNSFLLGQLVFKFHSFDKPKIEDIIHDTFLYFLSFESDSKAERIRSKKAKLPSDKLLRFVFLNKAKEKANTILKRYHRQKTVSVETHAERQKEVLEKELNNKQLLENIRKHLKAQSSSKNQLLTVFNLWLQGFKGVEIAKELGYSNSRINKILHKTIIPYIQSQINHVI